ncbi:hypothetical protein V8G54_026280 [Vigna mungo]|uniref:Uncharacterized protein n=1 Tax=Vigna mungo TaxID=3915 RepID=A0AAQ3RQC7_VIGMU
MKTETCNYHYQDQREALRAIIRFCPPGKYETFGDFASVEAISLDASILLSSISPIPAEAVASEISFAASLSPSARIIAARRSCSAFITTNLDRSASCCATCFCSTARENSLP